MNVTDAMLPVTVIGPPEVKQWTVGLRSDPGGFGAGLPESPGCDPLLPESLPVPAPPPALSPEGVGGGELSDADALPEELEDESFEPVVLDPFDALLWSDGAGAVAV